MTKRKPKSKRRARAHARPRSTRGQFIATRAISVEEAVERIVKEVKRIKEVLAS